MGSEMLPNVVQVVQVLCLGFDLLFKKVCSRKLCVLLTWWDWKEHCHEERAVHQKQIFYALGQAEAATLVVEIVRKNGSPDRPSMV
jgi:hypothetical protein